MYCSVLSLGRKENTRRMSQPDMDPIFTKIIYEIFCSLETLMWIFKINKIKCFYLPRILEDTDASILDFKFRPDRVSMKWLNLLRKICTIFAQIFFLRTFALFLRMKRNEFCAVLCYFFAQFVQNLKYFLRNVAEETKF